MLAFVVLFVVFFTVSQVLGIIPAHVREWAEACEHNQIDLGRREAALAKAGKPSAPNFLDPSNNGQLEQIKIMCNMAAELYSKRVCAAHSRLESQVFQNFVQDHDNALWKYIPNAQVIGKKLDAGGAGGNVTKATIGLDADDVTCAAGVDGCYNQTTFADPATCTLACDYDHSLRPPLPSNGSGIVGTQGGCNFFLLKPEDGDTLDDEPRVCQLKTQWQQGHLASDGAEPTSRKEGYEVFVRVNSTDVLKVHQTVLGRNENRPFFYFFPFSISKDLDPCHSVQGIIRTRCAELCSIKKECGGKCVYFEYSSVTRTCNLYTERPSTVDTEVLRERVVFPSLDGDNFDSFVEFDAELKDALAVADITWTRYTEDGIGYFNLDWTQFIVVNPLAYDMAVKRCWHARRELPTLTSREDVGTLAAKLQQLQSTFFKLFLKQFSVWVDVAGDDAAGKQNVLNKLAAELGMEGLTYDDEKCLALHVGLGQDPELRYLDCADEVLLVCREPEDGQEYQSTLRDIAILSYTHQTLREHLPDKCKVDKHYAATNVEYGWMQGICQWDTLEPTCNWCGVSCLNTGVFNLTIIIPDQSNSTIEEAAVNRLYQVPTQQLLDLDRLNKYELQVQDRRVQVDFNNWERLGEHQGLRHLHVGGNFRQGQIIPEEWGNMSNLYHIDINNNSFAGILPENFSQLSGVRHIQMNHNLIQTQVLPTGWSNLTSVDTRGTDFTSGMVQQVGTTDFLWIELQGNDIQTTSVPTEWIQSFCLRPYTFVDLRDTLIDDFKSVKCDECYRNDTITRFNLVLDTRPLDWEAGGYAGGPSLYKEKYNLCNTIQEKQIVGILFGGLAGIILFTALVSSFLARRRRAASLLDYLEKANPDKKVSNIKGFVEVMLIFAYLLDVTSDVYFGETNRHSNKRLVKVLSYCILINAATQFIHGNVILARRFYQSGNTFLYAVFHIPILPVAVFDLLVLVYHAIQPSEFLGIINVEQYWNSRKLFEVLYESLPQLVMQAVIFANTPVSSRYSTLAVYIVSFVGSAASVVYLVCQVVYTAVGLGMVRSVQRTRSAPGTAAPTRMRVSTIEVVRSLYSVLFKMATGAYITQSNIELYDKRATAVLEREGISFAKPKASRTQQEAAKRYLAKVEEDVYERHLQETRGEAVPPGASSAGTRALPPPPHPFGGVEAVSQGLPSMRQGSSHVAQTQEGPPDPMVMQSSVGDTAKEGKVLLSEQPSLESGVTQEEPPRRGRAQVQDEPPKLSHR